MSTTVNIGWLKDNNGEKFAPKTLSSQVVTSDGVNLEDKIEAQLNEFRNDMANKDHNHNDLYESKSDANVKFDEAKAYADTLVSGKADKEHTHDLYETKGDAQSKFDEAKAYADSAASTVKNDLLNGAGAAYDTLKELGELIVENKDAIDVLEDVATGKADAEHTHGDIYYTKTEIDNMELITVDDIDAICGASIKSASEVMF